MATQTGYKVSELGMIPPDWDVVELEEVAEIKSGGTPSTNRPEFWNGHILWCTPTDITSLSGKYLSDTNRKISELGLNNSAAELLPTGSVLMTSRATIGECAIVKRPMTTNQGFKNFICNRTVNNEFLYYLLSSQKDKFIELCNGSTFLEISTTQVRKFKIAIPKSTTEQTAIATVLSDTDALISSLQTLIAKKKAIKLSAMQNLLSGKILLPEFAQRLDGSPKTTRQTELGLLSEDWKVVELGDVLSPVLNKKVDAPFFTFIGMQDVSEEAKIINQTVLPITQLKSGLTYFEENDVLVAKITPCFENGKGGYAHNLKTQIGFGSTEFHILRANQQADAEFIYYWTISPKFRQQLALDMVGSAGHKRVPFQALQKFKIPLPSKPEQTAIAQLLSDMDAEIEALECRLKKMQSLKQGMMQTLLTGKIRLPLE